MLKGHGIKILQSVPHQPQQNGRAERFNRTIMDKAQALRLDACIPQSWWEFAVLHAVHLYNRTPIARLKWRTPFELVFNHVADVSHLRVFGSAAYVFLPEDVWANKLTPKSELMIFLGYPDSVKGYLFMRIHNNTLFTGATALFDETLFPKCPTSKGCGFTLVGETPTANDQPSEEVNIPLEDGFDDLDTDVHNDHPVPSLPKKGLDQHQDVDDHGSDTAPDPNPPVAPTVPPAIQQGGENVRRSGRRREVPVRPGNVYG